VARIRTIKPEFWQDEKLAPLEPLTRLVFLGLISMSDDAGRLLDSVKMIDAFIFPETDDSSRESLEILTRLSRIMRYTSPSGQKLIQIVNWTSHQKVNNPNKYVLPPPTSQDAAVARVTPSDGNPPENVLRVSGDSLITTNDQRSTTNDLLPPTGQPRRRQIDRCRSEMPATYAEALNGALRSARNPDALAAELCMIADGGHGVAYSWEIIGKAIHEMQVAGTQMGANTLRAFCRKAAEPSRAPPVASTPDDVRRQVEEIHRKREERIRRQA
jgi:hypothetical protein